MRLEHFMHTQTQHFLNKSRLHSNADTSVMARILSVELSCSCLRTTVSHMCTNCSSPTGSSSPNHGSQSPVPHTYLDPILETSTNEASDQARQTQDMCARRERGTVSGPYHIRLTPDNTAHCGCLFVLMRKRLTSCTDHQTPFTILIVTY